MKFEIHESVSGRGWYAIRTVMHPRSKPVWDIRTRRNGQQLKPGGALYRKVLRICEDTGITNEETYTESCTFRGIIGRYPESQNEVLELHQLRDTGIPKELLREMFGKR